LVKLKTELSCVQVTPLALLLRAKVHRKRESRVLGIRFALNPLVACRALS
jgi:hypothetical protein